MPSAKETSRQKLLPNHDGWQPPEALRPSLPPSQQCPTFSFVFCFCHDT